MSLHDHSNIQHPCHDDKLKWRVGFVLAGFLAIAGILLFTEHRAHVLGVLLWLPLVACPLMHLFMHGGHGSHSAHQHDESHTKQGSAP